MPRFIQSIFGYHAVHEKMYFNGGAFSSVNGRQFVDESNNAQVPAQEADLTTLPVGVPDKGCGCGHVGRRPIRVFGYEFKELGIF